MNSSADTVRRQDIDRLEIADLLSAHHFLVDIGDEQGCAAIYADDARFEGPHGRAAGAAAIARLLRRTSRARFGDGNRYLMGPVVVDLDGDAAHARSYWWVVSSGERPSVWTVIYDDNLCRTGERWQIASRREEIHPAWLGAAAGQSQRR